MSKDKLYFYIAVYIFHNEDYRKLTIDEALAKFKDELTCEEISASLRSVNNNDSSKENKDNV